MLVIPEPFASPSSESKPPPSSSTSKEKLAVLDVDRDQASQLAPCLLIAFWTASRQQK